MKALIPANYYSDESVFQQEMESIFSKTWQFACHRDALRNDNDFVVIRVAGRPLVVQNFKGELRCFLNVCSHRFSTIHLADSGNGPLRCPYHGWTYDSSGLPTGIPHRPRFDDLTPECVRSLALKSYRVECCGELVFVCLDPASPSLSESWGTLFGEMERLTFDTGKLIDVSHWDMACNWKVFVENTLEGYHVPFVHKDSFAGLNTDSMEIRGDSYASFTLGKISRPTPSMKKIDRALASRRAKPEGYLHIWLFPAYFMSSLHGVTWTIQQLVPISPGRTTLSSYMYHYQPAERDTASPEMMDLLERSTTSLNRKVLAEDVAICEAVQVGLRNAYAQTGMLSDEEIRIATFQRIYLEFEPVTKIDENVPDALVRLLNRIPAGRFR